METTTLVADKIDDLIEKYTLDAITLKYDTTEVCVKMHHKIQQECKQIAEDAHDLILYYSKDLTKLFHLSDNDHDPDGVFTSQFCINEENRIARKLSDYVLQEVLKGVG